MDCSVLRQVTMHCGSKAASEMLEPYKHCTSVRSQHSANNKKVYIYYLMGEKVIWLDIA